MNIYYKAYKAGNDYLDGKSYFLSDGGQLLPIFVTIEDIIYFFDESVDAGTIVGRGKKPRSTNFRLWRFRQMLETAKSFIENEKIDAACRTLNRALLRCDSEPWPKDFIKGESVPELASMIEGLMGSHECEYF